MLERRRGAGLNKRDMSYRQKIDPHNGLLNFKAGTALPGYWRYFPAAEFAPYIEHYWTVEWDLAEPALRETLPYPSAHIILEGDVCALSGVSTRKFSRMLAGRGRVLGVKFLPGGLRPFLTHAVSVYTDRVVPLPDVFGAAARRLNTRALAHADHHAAFAVVEQFLRTLAPQPTAELAQATAIAARIASDRDLRQAEQVAALFDIGLRRLQRLFGDYVGVSPKWLIRRYRLHEAAERLAHAVRVDWAQAALDLGYADQAHFVRDFKRLIGKPPAEYFRALAPMPPG